MVQAHTHNSGNLIGLSCRIFSEVVEIFYPNCASSAENRVNILNGDSGCFKPNVRNSPIPMHYSLAV